MRLAAAIAALATAFGPQVAAVQLPPNLNLYSLQPDGRSLLATGDTTTGTCAFVRIGESPLRISAHGTITCSRAWAEPVHPVLDHVNKSFTVRVRIARVEQKTGRVSEGPVVMTFQQFSDTQLETAYGPGTLWLFDTNTSRGSEILEVSTRTGRVQDTVRMPRIFRPLLAADKDGLWLAIATNGGAGTGPSPIYHVPAGASTPLVVHRGGRAALWLVASGHTVIADVLTGRSNGELWRFDEASGRAKALAATSRLNDWATSLSTDGSSVWTVREVPTNGKYFECDSLQIIRIPVASGKQELAATIPTPGSRCFGATYSTFTNHAFWFIYGDKLYRVG